MYTLFHFFNSTGHVQAIRKGRLMTPTSFTAMSGDLHVQIQFSGDEELIPILGGGIGGSSTTTTSASTATTALSTEGNGQTKQYQNVNAENSIISTLVISKFIDEYTEKDAISEDIADKSTTTQTSTATEGRLLERTRKEVVQNIPLFPDPRHNVTQIAVPCQTFTSGGLYEMQVVSNIKSTHPLPQEFGSNMNRSSTQPQPTVITTTLMPVNDERLRQTLDVRWPSAEMIVAPDRLLSYPDGPVEVTLRFPEVNCDRAAQIDESLPEFWLELLYCGKESSCSFQNVSKSNILYAEQVRGYPKQLNIKLGCHLFGLAGNYVVQLRPMIMSPNVPVTRRHLSVDWSEKYVFNVYARSIFPCDPHTGIGVLYEYPACILEQGDRVRVYGKLRADVASLKPPTSLHYVAEQRVVKSQHSLYFDCDLFSEKYVEYCFVYVTQSISGAVADVRMDCVPTLAVSGNNNLNI